MTELIAGLDEAGRGPVLGSMFIGCVAIEKDERDRLKNLALKDSKKLSDSQRRSLEPKIKETGYNTVIQEVTASEIDELSSIMSLNTIELRAFAAAIREIGPDTVLIDLPEPDADRFGSELRDELGEDFADLDIVAEHGADDTYPIVSAASILAKNAREDHINGLHEKYGTDFASGYPHDTPTISFLESYRETHGELPSETRMSWSTAQRIDEEAEQTSMDEF